MKRSFYHYLMTRRDPNKKDEITLFANAVEDDGSFPKQSEDYNEISAYLELNGLYLSSMDVYDAAWEQYVDHDSH